MAEASRKEVRLPLVNRETDHNSYLTRPPLRSLFDFILKFVMAEYFIYQGMSQNVTVQQVLEM